jgi:hypothetical protein
MNPGGKLTAVVRACGRDFDVDAFLAASPWRPTKVFRRGEPVVPGTRAAGRRSGESGFNVSVSEAGFDNFAGQLADAMEFLTNCEVEVRRLVQFPGVAEVVLDFGIARRDVAAQYDRLPAELVRRAGACGLAIELSHYSVSDDAPTQARIERTRED